MTLYEQLEKTEKDLKKTEEKKKELLEKKKKLLADIELDEAKKAAKKNEQVMHIIKENFGEVTEENIELFRRVMQEHSESIRKQKEGLVEENM